MAISDFESGVDGRGTGSRGDISSIITPDGSKSRDTMNGTSGVGLVEQLAAPTPSQPHASFPSSVNEVGADVDDARTRHLTADQNKNGMTLRRKDGARRDVVRRPGAKLSHSISEVSSSGNSNESALSSGRSSCRSSEDTGTTGTSKVEYTFLLACLPPNFWDDEQKPTASSPNGGTTTTTTTKVIVKVKGNSKPKGRPKGTKGAKKNSMGPAGVTQNKSGKWMIQLWFRGGGSRYISQFKDRETAILANKIAKAKLEEIKDSMGGPRSTFPSKEAVDAAVNVIRKAANVAVKDMDSSGDIGNTKKSSGSSSVQKHQDTKEPDSAALDQSPIEIDIEPTPLAEIIEQTAAAKRDQHSTKVIASNPNLRTPPNIPTTSSVGTVTLVHSQLAYVQQKQQLKVIRQRHHQQANNSVTSTPMLQMKRLPIKKRTSALSINSNQGTEVLKKDSTNQASKRDSEIIDSNNGTGNTNLTKTLPLKKRCLQDEPNDAAEKENNEIKNFKQDSGKEKMGAVIVNQDTSMPTSATRSLASIAPRKTSQAADTNGAAHPRTTARPTAQKMALREEAEGKRAKAAAFCKGMDFLFMKSVIAWRPDGSTFVIKNPRGLGVNNNIFAHFYWWGFRQIMHGLDAGAFYHPMFRRDHPRLAMKPIEQLPQTTYCLALSQGYNGTLLDVVIPRVSKNDLASSFGFALFCDDEGWTTISTAGKQPHGWLRDGDRIHLVNGQAMFTESAPNYYGSVPPMPLLHSFVVAACRQTPLGSPLTLRVYRRNSAPRTSI